MSKHGTKREPKPWPKLTVNSMVKEKQMTREEALGMAARLWCLPRNSHKEMDSDLAEDVANLLLEIDGGVSKGAED